MKKNKRNLGNYLINPRLQLKQIFWLTGTGLALIGFFMTTVYYFVSENYAILVDLSPMTSEAKDQLYSELHSFVLWLSLSSIGFVVFVAIIGLFWSHRIAGPMYHFKRVFQEITANGLGPKIRLRPNDEFHDVADSFNQMIESLGKRST